MTEGPARGKMVYALWGMANQKTQYQTNRVNASSRIHIYAKSQMQETLSKARKGKTLEELWGNEIASQMREKFKSRKSRGKPNEYELEQIRERMKSHHRSNPWKRNFQINGQLPKKTCPHCDVTMDPGNYSRYHGDKCKHYAKLANK